MKILMIGPQGSGKGTIGKMIGEFLGIPVVATGTGGLLSNIPKEHPWYNKVHEQISQGVLVDQFMVGSLLKDELSKEKYSGGYVLDGWYRSMKDVEAFRAPIDIAFLLNISKETTLKRLGSRRVCSKCKAVYNLDIDCMRPKVEGICDKCGGELIRREDDYEEAILKRLEVYNTETKEVLDYLRDKGILYEIDAEGSPDEVFEKIKTRLS